MVRCAFSGWFGLETQSYDDAEGYRYLETVRFLLAVPNGAWQWELLADPVLLHRPQRPPSQPFGLPVVCVQPQFLKFRVRLARKPVRLEDLVKRVKVPTVEGDQRSRSHHRFVSVQRLPGRARDGGGQGPEEPAQALDVPRFLQVLAHAGDLVRREHRQREHLVLWLLTHWKRSRQHGTVYPCVRKSPCAFFKKKDKAKNVDRFLSYASPFLDEFYGETGAQSSIQSRLQIKRTRSQTVFIARYN